MFHYLAMDYEAMFISNLNDLIVGFGGGVNVKHEIQTIHPIFYCTTAIPQVLATYLIFVQ